MRYVYVPSAKPDLKKLKSVFYEDLYPVFLLSRVMGVLPLSKLTNGGQGCLIGGGNSTETPVYSFFTLPSLVCVLSIITSAALTYCNFHFLFTVRTAPDINNARYIFVHLSSPIFYLSAFATSFTCFRLGRQLPHLATCYDNVTRQLDLLIKDRKSTKRYSALLVVGIAYLAFVIHYFSRLGVNGCYPPYELRYDISAHLIYNLQFCTTYLETLTGSSGIPVAIFAYVSSLWVNMLWNLRDVIIVSFSLELRYRFKVLAQYVQSSARLNWKLVREQHRQICRLVILTDDAISLLILQSYASNFYHICLDVYNALHPQRYIISSAIFRLFTVSYFLLRTIIVTLTANSFHHYVHRFLDHISEGQTYFTACKLFVIRRHLVLTIFSVIVTYELIVLGV